MKKMLMDFLEFLFPTDFENPKAAEPIKKESLGYYIAVCILLLFILFMALITSGVVNGI